MSKPAKKIQRRRLHAPEERPSKEREIAESSAYADEAISKLSVDLPESLHIALKQWCAANKTKIREWLIAQIKETTARQGE